MTDTTDIDVFHPGGPLPRGRLAIEASAGTGKTYALSTLAARYVAEAGVPIGELLIVTFTRAAAAELKDRVRTRLVEFAEALASPEPPANDDLLADVWATDREARLARVETAIAEFDSASITTIHGFAQQVIATLGSAVPTDPDAVLIEDSDEITRQVATDLLAAEAVHELHPADEVPGMGTLRQSAQLALNNPRSRLVPDAGSVVDTGSPADPGESDDPDDGAESQDLIDRSAARLRSLVGTVVDEVADRRRAAGTLSFDDLLARLHNALVDPSAGAAACHALRERYRVALIDEFQDTDPIQWAIFDAVFGLPTHRMGDDPGDETASGDEEKGGRETTLVIVGDPKQAIYAFRGANVHTYLQAAHAETTDLTGLATNWRSDPASLRATGALLADVTFGADQIRFHPVESPSRHRGRAFTTADGGSLPALSVRLLMGPEVSGPKKPGVVPANRGEAAIYRELAAHVRNLLETAMIPDLNRDDGDTRRLRPDDVAVLIAANRQGPDVRDALLHLGIPAVISRGDNVLESEASSHWHRLLHAVARPADVRRARAAALSWFFGWDASHAAAASEEELAAVQAQLHRWGEYLAERGAAAFVGRVWAESSVTSRVLRQHDGERSMTDLDHIAELLSLAGGVDVSPTTLLSTFELLAGGTDNGDPETDLAARRVESESRAVQIMTTFVAKGLEFPVVCCPTLWHPPGAKAYDNVWWDADAGVRMIDVASDLEWGEPDHLEERKSLAAQEAVGANLRVLYVALTRARHHTAVWWLPTAKVWKTGLARVLFARDDKGRIDPETFAAGEIEPIDEATSLARLAPLVEKAGGDLEVVVVDDPPPDQPSWSGAASPTPVDLRVATLDRRLDRATSRWSFTAITSRAHDDYDDLDSFDPFDDTLGDAGDSDEGDADEVDTGTEGRPDVDPARPAAADPGADALPLGDIAGGAGFGTLVHEILEQVDFTVGDLEAELDRWVDDRLAWNPWPVDRRQLVKGLAAVIRTPLGPLFAGQALADLDPADRLDELTFDLTLGEGGSRATDADIGRLLLDHLPADDPQREWAKGLATGPFSAVLAGHLTGSIDLVARIHHHDGTDRFVVSDYKTNRLAPRGVTPTAAHFRPDQLPAAMAEHHYPLQALLYTVALHRYLRWRIADYDPATHLGGTGYLFVRGMVGPDTPTDPDTPTGPAAPTGPGVPNGLFDWRPPARLITDLSDLLDGSLGQLSTGSRSDSGSGR